jgi:hypothetical protein
VPELVTHLKHHEPVVASEPAGSVPKAAFGVRKRLYSACRTVVGANRPDRLGDLLAISADVLHRRRTDGTRNSGQRLDTHPAFSHRQRDDVVPRLAGGGRHQDTTTCGEIVRGAAGVVDLDTANTYAHDRSVEALVCDDDVGPTAQDEHGLVPVIAVADRVDQLAGRRGVDEPSGRATETQRRQLSETYVLPEKHHGRPG